MRLNKGIPTLPSLFHGVLVQASGFRGHLFFLSNFLETIEKKFFLKFRTLEHGTKHPILKLIAYTNGFRRFLCSRTQEHVGTKCQKPNKEGVFAIFILRTMYKIIYLGNHEETNSLSNKEKTILFI
jgi:hypothetical protein